MDFARQSAGSRSSATDHEAARTIVLGVTDSISLRLLEGLPEELVSRGWDVHVMCSLKDGHGRAVDGVTFHDISLKRKPDLVGDLKALLAVLRLLFVLRPAIVSFGTPKMAFVGLLAAFSLRIPVRVYFLRGLRGETSRGLGRFIFLGLERFTGALSTQILSVSPSLRQKYLDLGLTKKPSKVNSFGQGSSHGVDLQRFTPPRDELGGRRTVATGEIGGIPPTIGFVGRLSKDKGIESVAFTRKYLFEAGFDCKFILVGPLEEASLEAQWKSSYGRPAEFLGLRPDIEEAYRSFDLLILPSVREGLPNVVLEAAAAAIPTVAFDVTGSRDAIQHMTTGILVPPGNDLLFAAAVELLLTEPYLRKKMGWKAREFVSKNFDRNLVLPTLADFHESVCKEPPRLCSVGFPPAKR